MASNNKADLKEGKTQTAGTGGLAEGARDPSPRGERKLPVDDQHKRKEVDDQLDHPGRARKATGN